MTANVRRSHPAKKKDIIEKRELALRAAIRKGCDLEKLLRLAEKVRDSNISFQNGLIYYAKDLGNIEDIDTDQIHHSEDQITHWKTLSGAEIIEKHKNAA